MSFRDRQAKAHYHKALTLAEAHDGPDSDGLVLACAHLGNLLLQLGDRQEGIRCLKRDAALGKAAFRDACPAAAATLSHIGIALDGGAVISRALHSWLPPSHLRC
jgi:hypothetical protein